MKIARTACFLAGAAASMPLPAFAQQQQGSRQGNDGVCATQMDRWVDLKFDALRQTVRAPAVADGNRIQVGSRRTLTFPRTIDRVEVDRDGIVAVSAPTSRSLRLTALGEGEAAVSVYGADGSLIEETRIAVVSRNAPMRPTGSWFPEAGERVVAIDVKFAAVSSSTLKALGFNFSKLSGDIQGAVVSPSSIGSYSFTPGGLSLTTSAPIQSAFNLFLSAPNRGIGAVLSALQTNGLTQILAEPTLIAHSGEKATFLAGGEFPVPVPEPSAAGGSTISIEYKPFGVRLAVMPRVVSENQIVLMIAPEVSEPDYANGVQLQGYTVPGLRRRCAETTVELGNGQSFVIAGLNYSTSSVSRDKVPFLGDIPVLGAFFKRQQNQKERQELIIVATPRLVDPLKPGEMPALPQAGVDPSFGDMIVGTDGIDRHNRDRTNGDGTGQATSGAPFGVVRH